MLFCFARNIDFTVNGTPSAQWAVWVYLVGQYVKLWVVMWDELQQKWCLLAGSAMPAICICLCVCVVSGQRHYKGIMGSCPQYPELLTEHSLLVISRCVAEEVSDREEVEGLCGGIESCVHTCMWLCVYVLKDRRKTFLCCESDAKIILVQIRACTRQNKVL